MCIPVQRRGALLRYPELICAWCMKSRKHFDKEKNKKKDRIEILVLQSLRVISKLVLDYADDPVILTFVVLKPCHSALLPKTQEEKTSKHTLETVTHTHTHEQV